MFENLTSKIESAFSFFSKSTQLDEKQVDEGLRKIRQALLESDVALSVAKEFIANVKPKAIGQEVLKSITPGQLLVKIVYDELVKILGSEKSEINLNTVPPAKILVVGVGNFSGISDDDDFLLAGVTQIRLDGLLLAGIIFASVGVLNDVTVTQASSVWELKESQPNYSPKELFVSGMRIGRDHIASTVYTLLFTYAGAALPTMLLIVLADRPTGFILSSEAISQEIVRTLVGSIGLVLAVPITTILAAVLAEKKN